MTALRPELPELPPRLRRLPVDRRGYPVPFFVAYVDGEPDFRVVDPPKLKRCVTERRCWVCGEKLGRFSSYVAGPMCAVNRVSAEPPSHRECAEWSAVACPFLTRPHMRRRDTSDLPDGTKGNVAGVMIERNPGVIMIWTTERKPEPFRAPGGVLFRLPDPATVTWWRERRAATREEVEQAMDSGLPLLMESAEGDGAAATAALGLMYDEAKEWLP